MIVFLIVVIGGFILALMFIKQKEHYLLLAEVIPQGRIISQEEGIIEYKGVQYILGTNNLKRKKYLIEFLNLLNLRDDFVIDLRFNRQVIIKTNKRGSEFMKHELRSGNLK